MKLFASPRLWSRRNPFLQSCLPWVGLWVCLAGGLQSAAGQVEHLRVNEFLAANTEQRADARGEFSDWIEIWNGGEEAVSLEGLVLTDEEGEAKWRFPQVTLEGDGYLVVVASGQEGEIDGELHTNFRLSREAGGYLALLQADGETVIDVIEAYGRQRADVSQGRVGEGTLRYFTRPTPGATNGGGIAGFVADTRFSVDRGFYEEPFSLEITTATEGATILYTLDGSEPKEGSVFLPPRGTVYTGPLTIEGTSTVRALAFKAGYESTDIDTQTYLFVEDIARQPARPEGWPADWGRDGEVGGLVTADYEMDPRVVDGALPGYGIREALLDLPTLSIVMDRDDFIGEAGIYTNPQSRGAAFEKACSLELIYPGEREGFQIDCGVEVHGNSSRRPWRMQKHSLRVSFKTLYGPSELRYPFFEPLEVDRFNKLVLRACFTDSWGLVSWAPGRYRPNDSQYIRDMWMKRSMGAMGHDTLEGNFMHLYVNGLYWGLFNPAEKMEAETLVQHLGSDTEDYDVIDDFGLPPIDGESAGWLSMHRLAAADLNDPENYRALAEACDLANFADYMLLHFYADAEDWPHHNGHAMRNREAGQPFRFYVWDQEIVLDNMRMRRYDSSDANRPGGLFQQLRKSAEFRLLFADRVQKHLFNGGALTVQASQDRYMELANWIDKAIVAESARWGDTQASTPYGNAIDQPRNPSDVDDLAYPPAPHGPEHYFTREDSWVVERDNVVQHYIPAIHDRSNADAILNELEDEDLWPATAAPRFNRHGGVVPEGFALQILPEGGFRGADTLYYTLDGTDPRAFGGAPSSAAQAFPVGGEGVVLSESVTVKARLQSRSNPFLLQGEWSPMIEATFRVGTFVSPRVLQVSEIMYRPSAPSEAERAAGFDTASDFEFIELVNAGEGSVILDGLRVTEGISFHFDNDGGQELAPGGRLLLVGNRGAMVMRYGAGLPIAGSFADGSRLANGGERITMNDAEGVVVFSFVYDDDDEAGWPVEADGEGHSLVLTAGWDPEVGGASWGEPGSWKASAQPGGTPGEDEGEGSAGGQSFRGWQEDRFSPAMLEDEAVAGSLGDPDGDGWANVIEYALGTDPLAAESGVIQVERVFEGEESFVEMRFPSIAGRGDVRILPEVSVDLREWSGQGLVSRADGSEMVVRTVEGGEAGGYLRLRVELVDVQNAG